MASGVEEVFAQRNKWILDTLSDYADPETILFVINALSSGVGVQEAHGLEVPDADVWRKTLSAMFKAAADPRLKRPLLTEGETT